MKLPVIDYEHLMETYNYTPKMMKNWATENETFDKQLDGPDVPVGVLESIIERGKLIDDLYRVFESEINDDQKKAMKKKVYDAVKPDDKLQTLLEKLKLERKEKEKADKKSEAQQKAPPKQKQPQPHQQGKGKEKRKKRR
ncbi:uncharacterized protein LOC128209572 [Mya arenaria]|nr:uncharacterized protein LOC128209572 [Mya arenaria]